jgi:hypothetical protein
MKTNLLVIGAIIAIGAMMVMVPTVTTTNVNAVCSSGGKVVACAGGGNALAKALSAFAFVFNGIAGAGTK